ncbi:hypothetical protein ZIOFF_066455 [Zingiber officinale]|uniref:Reticulon domain-containing protein n=1 Tax=Zingiber officinale TaxID=94328 RepID=A0A8J5F3E7_ZINOF|nr:hypothetical protein ZIOFF_066455 [Zingiber officinale]
MADWGPVLVAVLLFVLLSPGLLFQIPGTSGRVVEFSNFHTSSASILVHAIIYFALITLFLIAIGVHVYTEKLAAAVRRRLLPEKAKVFRLFGREKSVHHVLGGGQGTLLPFDPTHFGILKKILAGILVGATAIWILFEFVCYHLLPLISHGLIISLLTLFLWSKALTFINK